MTLPPLSRRQLLEAGLVFGSAALLPWPLARAATTDTPVAGGQLVVAQFPEPPILTSATTTAGPTAFISGKLFDGLLTYDFDLTPKPQLATSWQVSPDGLTITFKLRPGVTWHDGQPFTSVDVAYSATEVWKKFHSRGRSTFANLIEAETPDPLTVLFHLSKPVPYILTALASMESQILPKHLYEGTDVLANPHNLAPVGTGPFRFVKWERGVYIALERNPTYWDQPKPYLERLIFRILPDGQARSAALETGEVDLVGQGALPLEDIARLGKLSSIEVEPRGYEYTAGILSFEFNLDRPVFQDVRVRRAFAHAIDRDFIVRNIFHGYGTAVSGPIPPVLAQFYTGDVPTYPFDLDAARALLDQAGLKPDANGVRLTVNHDPLPATDVSFRIAEYLRDNFSKVGIKLQIRTQDFASFIRRVYTERDFDTIITGGNSAPDPAIGVQRFYWSKNFHPGVAFSNGSHYASPEADSLLEAAQIELDLAKRRDLYIAFQKIVQTDLPTIPIVAPTYVTVANKRVRRHTVSADGINANFAGTYLASEA